jgi:hypothetical protein
MAIGQEILFHNFQAIEQSRPKRFSESQLFGLEEHLITFRRCNGTGDKSVIIGTKTVSLHLNPL